MSILKQHFWGNTVLGILWIGVGISGIFDSAIANILQLVFFAAMIGILVIMAVSKPEADDEMSEQNYILAKAHTFDLMTVIFCVCAIAAAVVIRFWSDAASLLPQIFFLLIGAKNICVGIIFHKLEDE